MTLTEHSHVYALDQIAIKGRHPKSFFQDVQCAFRDITPGFYITKSMQRQIITYLKNLALPQAKAHRNLSNSSSYLSSSYNASKQCFDPPAGGFGAPQSVNGSFYHSHTDADFATLHPNVNLDTYKTERQSTTPPDQSFNSGSTVEFSSPAALFKGEPVGPVPTIKINEATATSSSDISTSITRQQPVAKVETEGNSQSTVAANSQASVKRKRPGRSSSARSAATDNLAPAEVSVAAADARSPHDEAALGDSVTVLNNSIMLDSQNVGFQNVGDNTQLTVVDQVAVQDTTKDQDRSQHVSQDVPDTQQAFMDAYNRESQGKPSASPGDSTYGTQRQHNSQQTLFPVGQPASVPNEGDNVSLTGNPASPDEAFAQPHIPDAGDDNQPSNDSSLSSTRAAANNARVWKTATPTVPTGRATRRPSRPTAPVALTATSSSLGKRAQNDADADSQEPSSKRIKSQS